MQRRLEQRYLVLGERLSACITDVIGSVNIPDINKAISDSLLVIMVTCTKVHAHLEAEEPKCRLA